MEKKHMHVQHSRLPNSASLRKCRGSESRFHLSVILFFGVFSICLLIGLLVVHTQYNDAKRQLTEELQDLKKSHASTTLKLNQLNKTLDEELSRSLSAQNIDSKCKSKEELQSNLTDRLLACNKLLFNITKERDQLNIRLTAYLTEGIDEGLSEHNNSMLNVTEENELSELFDNLTLSHHENTRCPDGWLKVNCSCYNAFGFGSWDEARADCIRRGADLVVINNAEEQNIGATLKLDAWIGLSDRETEGSWQWVDGTDLNFTSWLLGQPDNGGGDPILGEEDCAHVTVDGANWKDSSCNATKLWICEKKATIIPP